jgi:hypothetical protein
MKIQKLKSQVIALGFAVSHSDDDSLCFENANGSTFDVVLDDNKVVQFVACSATNNETLNVLDDYCVIEDDGSIEVTDEILQTLKSI